MNFNESTAYCENLYKMTDKGLPHQHYATRYLNRQKGKCIKTFSKPTNSIPYAPNTLKTSRIYDTKNKIYFSKRVQESEDSTENEQNLSTSKEGVRQIQKSYNMKYSVFYIFLSIVLILSIIFIFTFLR
jgi:uncharacterized cysteine cluster protein YcgN (CxxCxxCC family)